MPIWWRIRRNKALGQSLADGHDRVFRHEVKIVFDQPRRLMEDDNQGAWGDSVVLPRDVVFLTRRVKNDLSSP